MDLKVNIVNKHTYLGDNIITFFIGRGSKFGNPYTHLNLNDTKAEFQCLTREESINKYKVYFKDRYDNDPEFRNEFIILLKTLVKHKEINLMCYCSPKSCHGDFLSKLLVKLSHQLTIDNKK